MKYVKFLALISAAFFVVLALCVVGGYVYVSNADHKQLLINAAAKEGYKLNVESVKLDIYPTLRAQVVGLKLLPFVGEKNIVEVEKIKFEAPLLGFIFNKQIDLIDLQNPKAYLHRQKDKRANWEKPRKSRHSKSVGFDLGLLTNIAQITIEGGDFSYNDETVGQQILVRDFTTSLNDEGSGKKNQISKLMVNGVPIESTIRFKVDSSSSISVAGDVKVGGNTLTLEGSVVDANRKTPEFTGNIGLVADTLVPTLAKIGVLKQTEGLPTWPVKLQTKAEISSENISLSGMALTLADSTVTADASFKKSKQGGALKVDAAATALNLNALGLCDEVAKKTKSKSLPWSDELVDLKALQTLDFEIDAKLTNVKCGKRVFPEVRAFIANQDGLLKIHNVSIGFADQKNVVLSGQVDARKKDIKGNMSLSLNQVPLNKLVEVKTLELPLTGEAKFTFNGSTTQEMASSLGGEMYVKTEEGKVSGISGTTLVSGVSALFGGTASGNGSYNVTLFEAGYKIEDGVARTDIFQLDATELKAIGEGKIDIGRWLINYKITPQIGSSVSIPLLIKGSLNKPNVMPDVTSAQAIGMGVGTAVGGPVGAAAGAFIGNFLSGGSITNAATPTVPKEKVAPTPLDFIGNPKDLEKNVHDFLNRE